MPTKDKTGSSEPKKTGKPGPNKSGAHTQAGQQSQTGGGSRVSGHDRPAVADAGSKGGKGAGAEKKH